MGAVLSVLIVVFVSMLITRVATIALAATGLSRESARFQARSALTGAGFTTSESETVVRHPVRRRIVMILMLLGSAGIAAVIGSIVLAFVQPDAASSWWLRVAALALGIGALWVLSSSRWVDSGITRLTMWALNRYTSLEVRDYASLLHIGGDYVITELAVTEGSWLADRTLEDLALRKEQIIVLGVERPDGMYLGVPTGPTRVEVGDTLVLYSRTGQLAELDERRSGTSGDAAHRRAVAEKGREPTVEGATGRDSARTLEGRGAEGKDGFFDPR